MFLTMAKKDLRLSKKLSTFASGGNMLVAETHCLKNKSGYRQHSGSL
jgi:hypothetical protein